MASATGSGVAVRDAAREESKKTWAPQPGGWSAHPGRHGQSGPADVDPPGGWALVFMAFMLTVAAVAWGIFLIG